MKSKTIYNKKGAPIHSPENGTSLFSAAHRYPKTLGGFWVHDRAIGLRDVSAKNIFHAIFLMHYTHCKHLLPTLSKPLLPSGRRVALRQVQQKAQSYRTPGLSLFPLSGIRQSRWRMTVRRKEVLNSECNAMQK